jgi:hypothetical protein
VRAVFLILLSANLMFLAWARWIDTPREASNQDALSRLPRLQLVTEAPPGPKPTSAIAQKMAFKAPDPAQSCTSIGPFDDITGAARVAGVLNTRGFQLKQRAEEGETIEGYWVFVGGLLTDDDIGHAVEKLTSSGFPDAHVMKNFSTNRRVSVGMFTSRERAEKRVAAVKHMGLEAEIGERKFPGTVYWVDVELVKGGQPLPPEYSFAEVGHSKVRLQPCPPSVRPAEPDKAQPGDEGDGVTKLPRTTVASAPKAVP